jgi:hypothetical protein
MTSFFLHPPPIPWQSSYKKLITFPAYILYSFDPQKQAQRYDENSQGSA